MKTSINKMRIASIIVAMVVSLSACSKDKNSLEEVESFDTVDTPTTCSVATVDTPDMVLNFGKDSDTDKSVVSGIGNTSSAVSSKNSSSTSSGVSSKAKSSSNSSSSRSTSSGSSTNGRNNYVATNSGGNDTTTTSVVSEKPSKPYNDGTSEVSSREENFVVSYYESEPESVVSEDDASEVSSREEDSVVSYYESEPESVVSEVESVIEEPVDPKANVPDDLKAYVYPYDIDIIRRDMIAYGINNGSRYGMTLDESLNKDNSAWSIPGDTYNFGVHDWDPQRFKNYCMDQVKWLFEFLESNGCTVDNYPGLETYFRVYFEEVSPGDYNIYVFYC